MIGFKLKVQLFSLGELFEIVTTLCLCHLVIDLYDVRRGYAPVSRRGEGVNGERGREEKFEEKKTGFTDYTDSLHKFTLCVCVCVSVLALQFVCGAHTHTHAHTADDIS